MRNRFAARRFSAFVRTRRGEHSLREAAAEIGTISPSTLLRIEREEVPDIETFLHVCDWLSLAPREFLEADEVEERMSTLERVELALRHDGVLDAEVIDAFLTVMKAVYPSRSSSSLFPDQRCMKLANGRDSLLGRIGRIYPT